MANIYGRLTKTVIVVFACELALFAITTWIAVSVEGYGLVYVLPGLAVAAALYLANVPCLVLLVARAARRPLSASERLALIMGVSVLVLPLAYWRLNDLTLH
jgi:hypothetical protein